MKQFLKQHGLWVLFAAAVISVTLALMSYFSNTSSPLANLAGVIAAPFRAAYTAVDTWFADRHSRFADIAALQEENEQLRLQIAKMEEQVRQAESDSEENVRLHELLNLREKRRDFVFESASIVERSSSNWTSAFTLNRGTAHDVSVNDCVVTQEGYLVGVVSEVGVNWCTVLTVLDTDISLGAQVFRTSDVGVAEGDFSLMSEGRLKLGYLPADCTLLNGDLIVTSGLGGYYPSGLVLGTVAEVRLDDSGAREYAVLAPSAPLTSLQEVFIIKEFDIVD